MVVVVYDMNLDVELVEFGPCLHRRVNTQNPRVPWKCGVENPTDLDKTTTLYAFAACANSVASRNPKPLPPATAIRIMMLPFRSQCRPLSSVFSHSR